MTVDQLRARLEAGELIRIVDVRRPQELAGGFLPGAVNIPLGDISTKLEGYGRDEEIALVCQVGQRSDVARRMLLGSHTKLYNVAGGTSAWIEAGYPLEFPA